MLLLLSIFVRIHFFPSFQDLQNSLLERQDEEKLTVHHQMTTVRDQAHQVRFIMFRFLVAIREREKLYLIFFGMGFSPDDVSWKFATLAE